MKIKNYEEAYSEYWKYMMLYGECIMYAIKDDDGDIIIKIVGGY